MIPVWSKAFDRMKARLENILKLLSKSGLFSRW